MYLPPSGIMYVFTAEWYHVCIYRIVVSCMYLPDSGIMYVFTGWWYGVLRPEALVGAVTLARLPLVFLALRCVARVVLRAAGRDVIKLDPVSLFQLHHWQPESKILKSSFDRRKYSQTLMHIAKTSNNQFSNLRLGVYTPYAHENSNQSLYLLFLHNFFIKTNSLTICEGYMACHKGTTCGINPALGTANTGPLKV